jgi:hypothetical protein
MDITDLFKGQKLDVDCPACEKTFQAPAEKLLKGGVITCLHCNEHIKVNADDDSMKETQKALNALEKTFKNFGK